MFPGVRTTGGSIVGKLRTSDAARAVVAEGWPLLVAEMEKAGVTTPRRQAAFLTTLVFESWVEYPTLQMNDTRLYRGRGYIQLTGLGNYEAAGKALGVDLAGNPEQARSLQWSAKIATWYWTVARSRCNEYADTLQMGMVNAAIGYPLSGENDINRCKVFAEALRQLTGSVPAGITCTRAPQGFSTSAKLGQWSTDGYLVNNNVHNATESGPQTLYATSPRSWYVVADHSKKGVRPGSVKSYPDTQKNFDKPIDEFTEITSTFSMTNPPVGEWNATYDVWINGIGSKSTAEVMVWTDHRYPASLPPGNATETTTVTIDGQPYKAWWRLNGNGGRYIALVMDPKKASGSVDLLKIFRWLVSKGWLKGTDKVAAIEYGVEISNTTTEAGGPQTFRLNDYTLTSR